MRVDSQKLVDTHMLLDSLSFYLLVNEKSPKNHIKLTKKVENRQKKNFNQLSSARSTQKLFRNHNNQSLTKLLFCPTVLRHKPYLVTLHLRVAHEIWLIRLPKN